MVEIRAMLARPGQSVRELMTIINASNHGIALVVDEFEKLHDTLTDGDVRRGILAGLTLDHSIQDVCKHKQRNGASRPITADALTPHERLLEMMRAHSVRHIPLLEDGRVVGLKTLDELSGSDSAGSVQAVIMAGGFGTRLMPLTQELPKPMLPVGGRPLLEHIVDGLRDSGIHEVRMTTHYLGDKIRDHFQDGADFGVNLDYINEETPMGTAGALALMDPPQEPLLVLNGDILTSVDYQKLFEFHREQGASLTIGVRHYSFQVPYGVVEVEGTDVTGLAEKPVRTFFVNAGIYLLEPDVHSLIPRGRRSDMTDLVQLLLDQGRKVSSFPIFEYWLDIGQHNDYQQAQQAVAATGGLR